MMRDRSFEHTYTFDEELLTKTGMDNKFGSIFHNVGWSDFWRTTELDAEPLDQYPEPSSSEQFEQQQESFEEVPGNVEDYVSGFDDF
ncbi:hypothetical protein GQ55_4G212300 [Panicum hallii var. hallii]|uniref:Uncharacterized protein n=1 Tax=Panicum hallii var. hallii TaxID=1504633 RepID=A0A2T7DZA1_9POAL|nr:hypothetical protein GQ55_4G212300 [Panicum hallii var. hallii]